MSTVNTPTPERGGVSRARGCRQRSDEGPTQAQPLWRSMSRRRQTIESLIMKMVCGRTSGCGLNARAHDTSAHYPVLITVCRTQHSRATRLEQEFRTRGVARLWVSLDSLCKLGFKHARRLRCHLMKELSQQSSLTASSVLSMSACVCVLCLVSCVLCRVSSCLCGGP